MVTGRRKDLAYSILLIISILLYQSTGHDPLYAGNWYLPGVPVAILLACLLLRTPALFITGTTAAAIASLLLYMKVMLNQPHPDGLLVLGHLFSLPGLLIGTSVSAWLLRHRIKASLPWLVAGIAFMGAALGFLAAQMVVCNTLMYCGVLSIRG